jgi:hypothetical protein
MKLIDRDETVLVVIGGPNDGGLDPRDRVLAETLQRAIDGRADGRPYRRALVVGAREFLERPDLYRHPTITVGGPGVNPVAERLVGELPTLWRHEDRAFVQAELEETRRIAIWGMDAAATGLAVDAFLTEGYLDALLDRIWRVKPTTFM